MIGSSDGLTYEVINSDCLDAMRDMDDNSVDSVICDPPYALAFMGSKWDSFGKSGGCEPVDVRREKSHAYADENVGAPRYGNSHGHAPNVTENVAYQESMRPIFAEVLRVTKPGGYCLAFSSPRTFHRLWCAIEEAGWELTNTVMWVFGSGFPKGLNVSKALDKAGEHDAASEWDGWNTQLKPAWEPICVARKPLDGTVAQNVFKWGTGAMNIDACRIPVEPHDSSREGEPTATKSYRDCGATNFLSQPGPRGGDERGRYPANLCHDGSDEVLELFPGNAGQMAYRKPGGKKTKNCYGNYADGAMEAVPYDELGSAARFFYCAKASRSDRGEENDHPTCKPTALMQWLVRLVTRSGGLVVDPFCGSGSTGVACVREGMSFVGIEREQHYCEISEARIKDELNKGIQLGLF